MDTRTNPKPDRLDSIDCLRGLVIVLMALDHTRDFFGSFAFGGAENPTLSSPALFFTRWVTHFCAPTFILLAGIGACLTHVRGLSKPQLAGFLLSRGLWLVFLELTVVHFGWFFDCNFRHGMWQVIWAIGWSMVGLSLLIWLPAWVIGGVGLVIICGHNYFDGLTGTKIVTETPWLMHFLGDRGWLWDLLHNAFVSFKPAEGYQYVSIYPLLPWFGVLCVGYGLGPIMTASRSMRRKSLLALGLSTIVAFIVLRYFNQYGDALKWRTIPGADQPANLLRTVMSFIACTKYPPSLCYLLMTLGPALLFLVLFELPLPFIKRFFTMFGRVPLFFYILHLPAIHGLAKLFAWYHGRSTTLGPFSKGYELPEVYLIWAFVVLALYFPCLGYGWLKKRYGGVLKYL